ncbi:MAG: ATP-binding cassette domain-containing protein [Armatimonadota bacterium]
MVSGSLRLQGIRKSFDGVQALKGVDLELWAGEIHALIGENGAGKSTLIKIAGGIFAPDAGTIVLDGKPVRFADPRDAQRQGIVVIHQTPTLCPHLSVTENILLGHLPTRWGIVQWKRANELAANLLTQLGVTLPLDAPVGTLSAAQQQLVALARALSLRARWLILDEPTAALSRSETERLFAILRQLKSQGVGVLFVSHRLDEVLELADRITVLRDGEKVATLSAADATREQLITLMAGRQIAPQPSTVTAPIKPSSPLLRLRDVVVPDFVRGVSLEVRSGEVVGLFGLVGSGRSELAQALVGLRPIASGVVEWQGKPVRFRNPKEALTHGIAYLPEDRLRQGLLLPRSIRENIGLPNLHRFSRFGIVDEQAESETAQAQVRALRVKATSIAQPVAQLSGGNQQKVALGKWLLTDPQLLILDEPTHGIDVATKAEIHRFIADLKARGKAILLISSELEELQILSDRLLVFRQGRIVGEFAPTASQESILAAAFSEPSVDESSSSAASAMLPPYHPSASRLADSRRRIFRLLLSREVSLLAFLVAVTAFVGWRNVAFLSAEHWLAMVQESAPTLLAAGIMAAVIVSGNLDLSIGSVLGACAMAAGHAAKAGWALPFVIAVALMLGASIGLVNGTLTARLGISSVVVTLGMLGIVRGTMLVFTKGYWVIGLPEAFRQLSVGSIAGVPNPVWISLLVLLALGLAMAHTRWGRDLYAMGSNPMAAWMAGIPVRRRLIGVFVASGMVTGLAALLYAARFPVVQSETGKGFELAVITAAVLGGVNIFGGAGSVFGAVLGAFAVTVLRSALTFLQLPGEWDTFALGGLILLSVAVDAWRRRR